MQQANTLHVGGNQSLRALAFFLDAREASVGVFKLFLKHRYIFGRSGRHFRFQIGSLFLKLILRSCGDGRRTLLCAQLARLSNQTLLAKKSAFDTGDDGVSLFGLFLRGTDKEQINPSHHYRRSKNSDESNLETAV